MGLNDRWSWLECYSMREIVELLEALAEELDGREQPFSAATVSEAARRIEKLYSYEAGSAPRE